jgi:hypothetical protein
MLFLLVAADEALTIAASSRTAGGYAVPFAISAVLLPPSADDRRAAFAYWSCRQMPVMSRRERVVARR